MGVRCIIFVFLFICFLFIPFRLEKGDVGVCYWEMEILFFLAESFFFELKAENPCFAILCVDLWFSVKFQFFFLERGSELDFLLS